MRTVDEFQSCLRRAESGCLEWQASKANGYGQVYWRGRLMRAHRLAYELAYGPIPPGMSVCHRCDNPKCCDPAHLFLGTTADNLADMRSKGRGASGSRHGRAILNEKDVALIRRWLRDGMRGVDIAALFNVSQATVSYIKSGKRWSA